MMKSLWCSLGFLFTNVFCCKEGERKRDGNKGRGHGRVTDRGGDMWEVVWDERNERIFALQMHVCSTDVTRLERKGGSDCV